MIEVNYLAVLVAGIATFVIGGLWYSPVLFGNMWIKEMKMSEKDMKAMKKGSMALMYFLGFLTGLVTAYVLAHLLKLVDATTMEGALQLAFWVWLGFQATIHVGGMLWSGHSFKLFVINALYHLVTIMVAAAILVSWV